MLECSFHVRYKWVVANLSMTRGKFKGRNHYFVLEESALYSS